MIIDIDLSVLLTVCIYARFHFLLIQCISYLGSRGAAPLLSPAAAAPSCRHSAGSTSSHLWVRTLQPRPSCLVRDAPLRFTGWRIMRVNGCVVVYRLHGDMRTTEIYFRSLCQSSGKYRHFCGFTCYLCCSKQIIPLKS